MRVVCSAGGMQWGGGGVQCGWCAVRVVCSVVVCCGCSAVVCAVNLHTMKNIVREGKGKGKGAGGVKVLKSV